MAASPAAAIAAKTALLAACALVGLSAAPAKAQYLSTNSAEFNAGYGRLAGSENQPINVRTRDLNGNRVIIDGIIQAGEDQSSFSRSWGSADAYSGVGAIGGGASAIGNNLVVVTQGNYNTVIVNSTQINNGDISANGVVATGGVGDDQ